MDFQRFLEETNCPQELVQPDQKKITIDLNMSANGTLNETLFGAFASITKWLLKTTLDLDLDKWAIPVAFRGSNSQIKSFKKAFRGERKYIRAAKRFGLDDPRTYRNKFALERSIKRFEQTTGLKWPIE